MYYGWAGTALEIDLSQGKIESKPINLKLYETYLGGKGVGARLLWDRVPPEVEPFSQDNLLVFAAGVLVGTPIPSANKVSISYKSPQTNLLSYSVMGGFWAPQLKHAGYDTIAIAGKSPSPIYLWINNDKVEIRDATHLWGQDTRETQRIIREELANDDIQVVCIGPAGENKVHIASIEHRTENSASQTGPGAVMGGKNLKAIAVYGTKDTHVARPDELMTICESVLKRSDRLRKEFEAENWCYNHSRRMAETGFFGNTDEMPAGMGFENNGGITLDYLKQFGSRQTACYNCSAPCRKASLPNGVYSYPMCDFFNFSFACKIPDTTFSLECFELCCKYGLDTVSTARVIAFAIDLYQKGILTSGDTEGIYLEFGNKELAFILIENIARRQGLGDILANGTFEAARMIGRGAEKYTHLVKKLDQQPDYARLNPSTALILATADRAEIHQATCAVLPYIWGEEREEYLREGWWLFPREFEKYLSTDYSVSYEGISQFTYYTENIKTLADLTGLCWWWTGFQPPTVIKPNTIVKLISCATGNDIDETEAFKIASRVRTLSRANDVRLGIRRKDDTVPEKLFRDESTPQQMKLGIMKLDHDKFDEQIDKYYEMRGWNREGIPNKETLEELDLGYVRRDLEQRGFL